MSDGDPGGRPLPVPSRPEGVPAIPCGSHSSVFGLALWRLLLLSPSLPHDSSAYTSAAVFSQNTLASWMVLKTSATTSPSGSVISTSHSSRSL